MFGEHVFPFCAPKIGISYKAKNNVITQRYNVSTIYTDPMGC